MIQEGMLSEGYGWAILGGVVCEVKWPEDVVHGAHKWQRQAAAPWRSASVQRAPTPQGSGELVTQKCSWRDHASKGGIP
jgi:hypothetical protein